jgi:hypothetical protein
MENKSTIYGIRIKDKFFYIGKTNKTIKDKMNIPKSTIVYQYKNDKIREVLFSNENVFIEELKNVDHSEWYYEKLHEVFSKYKKGNPLLNHQWMLDGKKSYWDGKKRDVNTLKKLSESKFKKVVQYNSNYDLVKIWDSVKNAANTVFGDYCIINGSGCCRLNYILKNKLIKYRFENNYYWFKYDELMKIFDEIPLKIDLNMLLNKNEFTRKRTYVKPQNVRRYTVIRYDNLGNVINIYDNVTDAAYNLKTSKKTIQRLCNNQLYIKNIILKYGEKKSQPININCPNYEIKPLRIKEKKKYKHTRTNYCVLQYDNSNNLINKFNSVKIAAKMTNNSEQKIRKFCVDNENSYFKYGEKITITINK